MDNSIYVMLSRQQAVFRDMAVTANNIANVDTPGYHAEKIMFTDYLVNEGNRDTKLAFTQDISSWRDTQTGPLKATGNPFDLAIMGDGFFVVDTPAGLRYTRAGNFTVGNDGSLMTAAGDRVTSLDGQPIELGENDLQVTIGENGVVSAKTAEGAIEERGQLGLVEFDDPQRMTRLNNQLYETDQEPRAPINSRISQGVLEMSNVSGVSELVRVTQLSRATSSTAKFIEVMYDLARKTSNAYARPSNN